jgi:hypothetical protein
VSDLDQAATKLSEGQHRLRADILAGAAGVEDNLTFSLAQPEPILELIRRN